MCIRRGAYIPGDRPIIGDNRPIIWLDRPILGKNRPIIWLDRPIIGKNRPINEIGRLMINQQLPIFNLHLLIFPSFTFRTKSIDKNVNGVNNNS
ncbi:MAG: hypothetical protein ABS934_12200 [Psychrobacillus sp.]